MKKYLQLTCFSLVLLAFSCKEESPWQQLDNTSNLCAADVICTEMFASLLLNVKDQHGRTVKLDKVVSARSNGQQFEFKPEPWMEGDTSGNYVFWTDSQLKQTQKQGENLVVKGFRNEQVVFAASTKVGHDCCHVQLKDGPLNIVVQVSE